MIIKETWPGSPLNRKYYGLSEEEAKRLEEIMLELKEIFNAEGAGLIVNSVLTVSDTSTHVIKIYGGPRIGL